MFRPIHSWHTTLNMPKHDHAWHEKDLRDELTEYHEARGPLHTWSELSDVVYTYTRARWSGHDTIIFPFSNPLFALGTLYMIPKYTLRWKFFRTLGHRLDPNLHITEVRNPEKDEKLRQIAVRYGIDPARFVEEAHALMHR